MRRIRKVLAAGANVVLTTKGIDDFCLKAFVDAGCIACRRVPSDDMKRIAKATGARLVVNLGDEDGGEAFEAEWLGEAEAVFEERVSDDDMVFITGTKTDRCARGGRACARGSGARVARKRIACCLGSWMFVPARCFPWRLAATSHSLCHSRMRAWALSTSGHCTPLVSPPWRGAVMSSNERLRFAPAFL